MSKTNVLTLKNSKIWKPKQNNILEVVENNMLGCQVYKMVVIFNCTKKNCRTIDMGRTVVVFMWGDYFYNWWLVC